MLLLQMNADVHDRKFIVSQIISQKSRIWEMQRIC